MNNNIELGGELVIVVRLFLSNVILIIVVTLSHPTFFKMTRLVFVIVIPAIASIPSISYSAQTGADRIEYHSSRIVTSISSRMIQPAISMCANFQHK